MKVKVDYPNKPKGVIVDIPALGSFKNGSTNEVTDAQWERFLNRHPTAREVLGDNKTQATIPFDIPKLERDEDDEPSEATEAVIEASTTDTDASVTTSDKE